MVHRPLQGAGCKNLRNSDNDDVPCNEPASLTKQVGIWLRRGPCRAKAQVHSLLMWQCLEKSDDAALHWGEPAMLKKQSKRWLRRPLQGQGLGACWSPQRQKPFPVLSFQCFALPDDRSAQPGDATSSQRSSESGILSGAGQSWTACHASLTALLM